jgi:CRISPR/Cas system CSM-associated protein Csm3 (group 7 of RAMP superfamily)
VKDLLVDTDLWFDQYQVRDGVAIDRDTETAAEHLLYDYEVVPADTSFRFELVIENAQPWQLGMVLLGLKAFEDGEIAIGGFRSRGLGTVQLEWAGRYYEVPRQGNPGRPDADWVIRYLEGQETGVDARSKMNDWVKAFRQELAEVTQREV